METLALVEYKTTANINHLLLISFGVLLIVGNISVNRVYENGRKRLGTNKLRFTVPRKCIMEMNTLLYVI